MYAKTLRTLTKFIVEFFTSSEKILLLLIIHVIFKGFVISLKKSIIFSLTTCIHLGILFLQWSRKPENCAKITSKSERTSRYQNITSVLFHKT